MKQQEQQRGIPLSKLLQIPYKDYYIPYIPLMITKPKKDSNDNKHQL